MEHKDTIVIGAGLTGLSTAFHLNEKKADFLVLEKDNRPGGVIQTLNDCGFTYEKGPNTGTLSNIETVEMFEKLGNLCTLETAKTEAQKRYILKNGSPHALPSGLISAIQTPLFTFKDKLRILGEPFRKRGNDPDENLADLVKRRMGKSFLDYAIDPFLSGIYAGDPEYLVTQYATPKLYALEQNYGSFVRGSLQKKLKRSAKEKKITRQVFSAKGGLSNFTNALYTRSGKENFLFSVSHIQIQKNKEGFILKIKANNQERLFSCNHLITTTGAYSLPDFLTFISKEKLSPISRLKYAKIISINIGFKQWEGIPLDAFGILIPSKEKRKLLGYLFMSAFLEGRVPSGGALLTVFMGGTKNEKIFNLSDQEIRTLLSEETVPLLRLKKFNPDLFVTNRYAHAIPQYGKDSRERLAAINNLEKEYPGLLLGGNFVGGIGMANRISEGKRLADKVLQK
ncbi:MAG: protoporphyrinogen oxidase [Bacteroidia bacterium]|nr:MAG: protoporphyrinogen oxidase [Bacteroidia bacterium]